MLYRTFREELIKSAAEQQPEQPTPPPQPTAMQTAARVGTGLAVVGAGSRIYKKTLKPAGAAVTSAAKKTVENLKPKVMSAVGNSRNALQAAYNKMTR